MRREGDLLARALAPAAVACDLRLTGGVDEVTDAAGETSDEEASRGRPVAGELRRLIDHQIIDVMCIEDRPRTIAASTGIEIVAVEVEQHDASVANRLKQRIELRRVAAPALVEI